MNTTFTPNISQDDAIDALLDLLADRQRPSTIYVIQRHVSASGMTRRLSIYIPTPESDDILRNVTWLVAAALGENVTDHNGKHTITARGAGMDMHFHTVYRLASKLYGDGYALSAVTL